LFVFIHLLDDGLEASLAEKSWVEKLPYPAGLMKWLYKTPILLYRLGLGFLVGRLFLILTTVGRKSGQPRRTAIEFHEYMGRRYVFSAWGAKADWYRNIEANPCITIQTWRGSESVLARRITSDVELAQAFAFAMSNPSMRMVMQSAGFGQTLEQFLAQKERFIFVTFDPIDQPTSEPLKADLAWVWGLLLPLALIASTGLVFRAASHWLEKEAAYLLGFAFYWLFWCLLVPGLILGKQGFASLLVDRTPLFGRRNWPAALLWLVVIVVAVFMYGQGFVRAPLSLILAAIPLATANGFCEEILWRGLYARLFPNNPWLGIVYPSVGFALWHFAPQMALPDENTVGFVVSTLFLGLAYGFIAYRTGSAKWTAISHSLSGILALSGYLAPSLLALIE
jgi:deazaflavin-dependent oxidoreductase (nitroreductase family)